MTGSPTLPDVVAREVRAEMGRQRKSRSALATALGVSDMYISRRVNGEVPFDLADLEAIARELGIPVVNLISTALERAA